MLCENRNYDPLATLIFVVFVLCDWGSMLFLICLSVPLKPESGRMDSLDNILDVIVNSPSSRFYLFRKSDQLTPLTAFSGGLMDLFRVYAGNL